MDNLIVDQLDQLVCLRIREWDSEKERERTIGKNKGIKEREKNERIIEKVENR